LPDLNFSRTTDANGKLVWSNLPSEEHDLDMGSRDYQVPLQLTNSWRDRHVRVTFSPGMTNEMHMVMEPKGTDYIGTAK
jgi:hypothetical protein